MMLGWKDRKTGKLYDQLAVTRVEYTDMMVSVFKDQETGRIIVVSKPYELIEFEGIMTPRFRRWGINTGHVDDSF